jgi:hypothetical protein
MSGMSVPRLRVIWEARETNTALCNSDESGRRDRAKQANRNLQLANLLSFAACRFVNRQSFEPSIVKRVAGIEG